MKLPLLPLLLAASLALPGCVASMAVGAVGAVARAGGPKDVSEDRRGAAAAACSTRAGAPEHVHIIDAQQARDGRVTVWGIVQDASGRRAFECRYDGKVAAFKLRPAGGG